MNTKILIIFIIFLIIYFIIFLFGNKNSAIENFSNSTEYKIIKSIIPGHELDSYIIKNNDNKIIYKTDGKWTLEEIKFWLIGEKNKIIVNNVNNIYKFSDKITVEINYTGNEGKIIINNHQAEINYKINYKNSTNLLESVEFNDNSKIIAKIEKDSKKNNEKENIFILTMYDNMNKYITVYIISFIIISQINKENNLSFDNIA